MRHCDLSFYFTGLGSLAVVIYFDFNLINSSLNHFLFWFVLIFYLILILPVPGHEALWWVRWSGLGSPPPRPYSGPCWLSPYCIETCISRFQCLVFDISYVYVHQTKTCTLWKWASKMIFLTMLVVPFCFHEFGVNSKLLSQVVLSPLVYYRVKWFCQFSIILVINRIWLNIPSSTVFIM